jgi:hypothetical protein
VPWRAVRKPNSAFARRRHMTFGDFCCFNIEVLALILLGVRQKKPRYQKGFLFLTPLFNGGRLVREKRVRKYDFKKMFVILKPVA